jgi:hypothetical protein
MAREVAALSMGGRGVTEADLAFRAQEGGFAPHVGREMGGSAVLKEGSR